MSRSGIGLRSKLAIAFLFISVIPLLVTMYIAFRQGSTQTEKINELQHRNKEISTFLASYSDQHHDMRTTLLAWGKSVLTPVQLEEFSRLVEDIERELTANVENGLAGIQEERQTILTEIDSFAQERQIFFIGFIVVVICASTALALTVGKWLTDPILQLTTIANSISQGEIEHQVDIHAKDEIGQLSQAFHAMTTYLKTMANTANNIAQGNIQEIPKPRSAHDQLGNAFYLMGQYLQDVSDTARRISHGNFVQTVTLKSSQDELGRAFQEMTERLGNALQHIKQEVQTVGIASETTAQRSQEELRMVQEVLSSAEETSSSMMEMQASVEEVSGNMSGLSHSIEETVSSIEEMNMSIKQIADNAEGLSDTAQETFGIVQHISQAIERSVKTANEAEYSSKEASESAYAGQTSVKEIIEGMDIIQRVVAMSAETIQELGNRSQEIDSITEVISEIADQTALLALNASIIAAQAGEHGRGFAVVANEVKELAQRSSNAAKEIGGVIKRIQTDSRKAVHSIEEGRQAVDNGVALANKGGEALETILQSVQKTLTSIADTTRIAEEQTELSSRVGEYMEMVLTMVNEISRATSEQKKGAVQVIHAVEQMRDLAEQVKRATIEQTKGTHHVLEAMDHVTLRVQESSERSHEIAEFSKELAQETTILGELLQQFTVKANEQALVPGVQNLQPVKK